MDQWAFFDELKAGTVRNAYLFYGPEAYIRKSALTTLQKKLLTPGLEDMNCTFMQSPTAQQIVENCETLPMLGDWRLVIVQGLALLESGKAKDEAQEARRSAITSGACRRAPASSLSAKRRTSAKNSARR